MNCPLPPYRSVPLTLAAFCTIGILCESAKISAVSIKSGLLIAGKYKSAPENIGRETMRSDLIRDCDWKILIKSARRCTYLLSEFCDSLPKRNTAKKCSYLFYMYSGENLFPKGNDIIAIITCAVRVVKIAAFRETTQQPSCISMIYADNTCISFEHIHLLHFCRKFMKYATFHYHNPRMNHQ